MNIPFPSEADFLAETTARHLKCWSGEPEDRLKELMAGAIPRTMEAYRSIAKALDGPRDRERSIVDWALYRAFVDPLVTAETTVALRLQELFRQVYQHGRRDERREIRESLRADVESRLGSTIVALITEDIKQEACHEA